jgi:hypothetical protein
VISLHRSRKLLYAALAGLAFVLVSIAVIVGVSRALQWETSVSHYRSIFEGADRVSVNGVRADLESGRIAPIVAELTNSAGIERLSDALFGDLAAGTQAEFSYSPPIAGTRLHITILAFSADKKLSEFEVVGSSRLFLSKYVWLDTPDAEIPEAIRQVCEGVKPTGPLNTTER